MAIVDESLRCSGLFEAELLLELMMRYWRHPRAADSEYRNELLEHAAESLRLAASGQKLIDAIPASKTNLVAAVWYVEWAALANVPPSDPDYSQRQAWLETVKKSLPSCFVNPDDLF
jgi:hypothetical protein